MYGQYLLENGTLLEVFLQGDLLDKSDWIRGNSKVKVISAKNKREYPIQILQDENKDKYFVYSKQKIYFKDYIFTLYEELVEKLNNGDTVNLNEILCTFTKEPEKVCVLLNTHLKDFVTWQLKLPQDTEMSVLFVPKLDGHYNITDWSHKIEFTASNEEIKSFISDKTFYFSDFVDKFNYQQAKLVIKDNYAKEYVEKILKYGEKKKKLGVKIQNMFKNNDEEQFKLVFSQP